MSNSTSNQDSFIRQATALIEENLSDETFGVSELAEAMSMSRSNLLRKIKKQTGGSASQFIRQVRLQKGMEMLRESSMTVSEISYAVGFGSTSYFIKCFREHYGYPPGEASKMEIIAEESEPAPGWVCCIFSGRPRCRRGGTGRVPYRSSGRQNNSCFQPRRKQALPAARTSQCRG